MEKRNEGAMAEFDPYHKWFGIRADQQPADHYRLLGIDTFETDPDIIESAAEQRMTYLQTVANGPYVEPAQKLLNEVSSVRVVLLNDDRRAEYDARLRIERGTKDKTSEDKTTKNKTSKKTSKSKRESINLRTQDSTDSYRAKPKSPIPWIVWACAGFGGVVLMIGLIVLFSGADDREIEDNTVQRKSKSKTVAANSSTKNAIAKTANTKSAKSAKSDTQLVVATKTVPKTIDDKTKTAPVISAAPQASSDNSQLTMVVQTLAAKEKPRGLVAGAVHFDGPRGNGRSGANGVYWLALNDRWKDGTEWRFDFTRNGTARGVHIIHPHQSGHVMVNLLPNDANVDPSGQWRGYLGQAKHPRRKTVDYAATFPIDAREHSIISRLDRHGNYTLQIDEKLVLSSTVTSAKPLVFPNTFKGNRFPSSWPAGSAGLIIGPRDRGVNLAKNAKFGPLVRNASGSAGE